MDKKTRNVKIERIIVVSIVMCAVASGVFYAYSTLVPKAIAALEEKGKMENTIWVVENFTPMISAVAIIAVLLVIYKFVKAEEHRIQSEKAWIMLAVTIFIYAIMLPYVVIQSQGCFDPVPEGEEDVLSLLEKTMSWFAIGIIPFMITTSYHFVMSGKKARSCDAQDTKKPIKEGQDVQEEKTNDENTEE